MIVRRNRLHEGISNDSTSGEDTVVYANQWTVELYPEEICTQVYYWMHEKQNLEIDPEDPMLVRKVKSLCTRLENADEKKVLKTNLTLEGRPIRISAYWKDATKTEIKKYKLPSDSKYCIYVTVE